jgi:arylsulfatase A-like enzyme
MCIYPTLIELTGLPVPPHIEGPSVCPLLADPQSAWDGVALTTHGRGNHGVRSTDWRYIRYADGSEELYHHRTDPHEWNNLADDPQHAAVKQRLAAAIPAKEVAEAPSEQPKPATKGRALVPAASRHAFSAR